ncbi:hypothetical protein PENSPDRAFT_656562 [Peniophora sp. CONT]|nr:hypothetical protein PENSPDRAFT_656562 [Peniophora sp. CONT]
MHDAVHGAIEHRNELVPISVLPAELLAQVFEYLSQISFADSCSYYGIGCRRGWTDNMLVCRRWRTVAVQCASLWATVTVNGNEPMDLFLERAKAAPLSVTGCLHMYRIKEVQRLERLGVFEHCGGLKSLGIQVMTDVAEVEIHMTCAFAGIMGPNRRRERTRLIPTRT